MESGQPIQPAIYATIKESLLKCYTLLKASHAASSPQESVESLTTGPDSLPDFDVDALVSILLPICVSAINFIIKDPALGLEIPSLLFFPGLMDMSGTEW